jgi:hypothetical protein
MNDGLEQNLEPGASREVDGYVVSREDEDGPLFIETRDGEEAGELKLGDPDRAGRYADDEWVLKLLPSTMLHGLGQQPTEADAIRNAIFYIDAFDVDDEDTEH